MKYKGIIFDLDGVLCSTDRFHFEAWKQTAEEVGAPFDETINMKLRGVSRMESLEIILSGSSKTFTDAEKERLATEKNDRYRKLLAQMSPADMPTAVRDALTALHNALEVTELSEKEQNIIASHMWPLCAARPRSWEAWLVNAVDTLTAFVDVLGCNGKLRKRAGLNGVEEQVHEL